MIVHMRGERKAKYMASFYFLSFFFFQFLFHKKSDSIFPKFSRNEHVSREKRKRRIETKQQRKGFSRFRLRNEKEISEYLEGGKIYDSVVFNLV